MGFSVISVPASPKAKKRKVTCVVCGLKKCVGRCHFERVERPRAKRRDKRAACATA